jgi:2-oxoisovalerate dehydrogenase E1 component
MIYNRSAATRDAAGTKRRDLTRLHEAYDWREVARLALLSRKIDEAEEGELTASGAVTYQFSAKGHELGQLLICQLLGRPMDAAAAYYRSRPFLLAAGLTVEEALASDMAKQGGVSAGRDVGVVFNLPRRKRVTVLPMAGDVGSQYTPAVGWAQAIRYRLEELGQVDLEGSMVVIFGGDGSVATNGFWSALNIATTLKLPILFVVEDNGYAISVQGHLQTPGGDIAANLASFGGLKTWSANGSDPAETAGAAGTAVDHVRAGHGPGLLRLTVPRLSGHSSMDNQAYKSEAVLRSERDRDPLLALHDYLVPELFSDETWRALEQEVQEEVAEAAEVALASPSPEPDSVTTYVFSSVGEPQAVGGLAGEGISPVPVKLSNEESDPRRVNMVEAINRTLDVELTVNPRCLVFGEDVAEKGGVHTTTMGLVGKHGPRRVFDTSLSEEGIVGRAVGMAMAGLMPAPEIQFRKYADPATEQINNCGTLRWRTANRFAAPMVLRMAGGFGRKVGDPWHSVTGESVFAHAVGWQIAIPSNATDAVGLLRTALRGNDPVIFFEHRALLDAAWSRRPYPGDDFVLPFGQGQRILTGDDLTVVTWGAMVERCQAAAEAAGASVDLIDLRTIVPWDRELVLDSVSKTSKCLIVQEDIGTAGFGAEIAATVVQERFLDLDGPVERLAAPAVPVPFNMALMEAVVPTASLIQQRMERLLAF